MVLNNIVYLKYLEFKKLCKTINNQVSDLGIKIKSAEQIN